MRALALAMLLALGACGGSPDRKSDPNDRDQSASTRPLERAKIHTELGVGYYESGKLGVALEELNTAIAADKTYAPAWNARALVYMELKDDALAESDFKQALKLDPESADTKNNYGLYLCQRKRAPEGIRYLLDAIKNPLYTTPDNAYKNAGLCSRNAGDMKMAEEYFLKALKLNPSQPQALYNMAEINFARGDYAQAKAYMNRYVRVVPSPGAEELWLGARIERRLGDRTALMNYGSQLRRLYPSAPETKAYLEGRFE
jgi:type IV pilus assembly protein PilF